MRNGETLSEAWDAPPQTLRYAQGDNGGGGSLCIVGRRPEVDPASHRERVGSYNEMTC